MTTRRLFLTGAASLLAAPAIIKVESLMRVVMPKRDLVIAQREFIFRTSIPDAAWREYTAWYEKQINLVAADWLYAVHDISPDALVRA